MNKVDWICEKCGTPFKNVVPPVRHTCIEQKKLSVSLPVIQTDNLPCVHYGRKLRDILCDSCGGKKVETSVFECKLHGECTKYKNKNNIVNCHDCKANRMGYQPKYQHLIDLSEPHYFSTSDLIEDTIKMIPRMKDGDCIIGIARSGILPASVVATHLYRDLYILDIESEKVEISGRGLRKKGVINTFDKVYVIDDSVWNGDAIASAKRILAKDDRFKNSEISFVVVYAHHKSSHIVDMYHKRVSNHFFEWNFMNSPVTPLIAIDFDGILCNDFTEEEDDDGENYIRAIANRKTTQFYPNSKYKPYIITARLSKYRKETEDWLAKHNMVYEDLIMCDLPTIEDRNNIDICEWKAKAYEDLKDTVLYVESDYYLAKGMKHYTNKLVLHPYSKEIF